MILCPLVWIRPTAGSPTRSAEPWQRSATRIFVVYRRLQGQGVAHATGHNTPLPSRCQPAAEVVPWISGANCREVLGSGTGSARQRDRQQPAGRSATLIVA